MKRKNVGVSFSVYWLSGVMSTKFQNKSNVLLCFNTGQYDFDSSLAFLTDQEIAYFSSLSPNNREKKMAQRVSLKRVLSRVFEVSAKDLPLKHNEKGAPFLAGFDINISHSHSLDLQCCYLTPVGCFSGVDVERLQFRKYMHIVDRYFTSEDKYILSVNQSMSQLDVFYHLWVAKESVIKALALDFYYGLSNLVFKFRGDSIVEGLVCSYDKKVLKVTFTKIGDFLVGCATDQSTSDFNMYQADVG